MKKFIAGAVALLMCSSLLAGCVQDNGPTHTEHNYEYEEIDANSHKKTCGGCEDINVTEAHKYATETDLTCTLCGYTRDWFSVVPSETKQLLSADGYVKDNISDFSQYVGTSAYRTVSTAEELLTAIKDAKYSYTTVWDDATQTYTQTLDSEGKVHVIEITQDLNLGYFKLSDEAKATGIVTDFAPNYNKWQSYLYFSDMFVENGISQIKVENTSNLLIYSKNGAKITHAGFKLTSDTNVVFRNLQFDEMWQWEDAPASSTDKIGDYDWFGWAYFKISFCGYIWIDHCTFGKSYDGQIDYSNTVYNADAGTAFRAPYGADGSNGLHISWCKFNAGSDDEDGYLYKMMAKIEDIYQAEKENDDGSSSVLYYKTLRDNYYTFEDILYGLAIPQKKGFLCGDNGNDNSHLQISFANCTFTNLEDRIPKLRGGNAVMYNCIVDSSQYFGYRAKLLNAKNLFSTVNSGWKCALSSQALLAGSGGSVYAESCIYKGINEPFKNNEGGDGGYQLVNCSFQRNSSDTPMVGSTTGDSPVNFPATASKGTMSTANFSWHTADGEAPFTISAFTLDELAGVLNNKKYGAGVTSELQDRLLKNKY